MTLRTRFELRQGTQLIMTPQLQQSIKLLQLDHLDLPDVVAQEPGDNPLLTTPDDGHTPTDDKSASEDAFTDAYDTSNEPTGTADWPADEAENNDGEDTAALAERFDDWDAPVRGDAAEAGPACRLEHTLSKPETLRGHLVDQLNLEIADPIDRLIEQEDPSHPLSDDRLAEILRLAGIDIARRTVAKYHGSLRIPSPMSRRRLKKQAAFGA